MKIAVIGAGITGLSIAWFLTKKGVSCDIYESSDNIGGLAGYFNFKGCNVDKFYHHFYTRDSDLVELLIELNLDNKLVWEKTPTGMYFANKTWDLSNPSDLIRFKPLNMVDRFKMGLLVYLSQKRKSTTDLADINVKKWIIKNTSKKTYEIMWEPLLRSKFGNYCDEVSAEWLCSKFIKRGGSRTRAGREKLGSLKGGLGIFLNRFEKALKEKRINIKKSTKIIEINSDSSKCRLKLDNGTLSDKYDLVVSSTSSEIMSDLIAKTNSKYSDELKKIKYLANITLILFLKESLSNHYWLNVNDPNCPFVGVIEHTKLVDKDEFNGLNLVYISKYLPREDKYFSYTKDEVLEKYIPWLLRIFPKFNTKMIVESVVCRDIYTQPVITTGYRKLIPEVKTPIPNLYYVSMAQIYPDDRQVSNAVKSAKAFVDEYVPK